MGQEAHLRNPPRLSPLTDLNRESVGAVGPTADLNCKITPKMPHMHGERESDGIHRTDADRHSRATVRRTPRDTPGRWRSDARRFEWCPYFVSHAMKAAGTIIRPMYLARGACVCWASELGDPNAAYGSCLAPRVQARQRCNDFHRRGRARGRAAHPCGVLRPGL